MSLGGASCNILPKYFETTAPAMSEGMEMFFNAIDVEECEVSSKGTRYHHHKFTLKTRSQMNI